VAAIDKIFGENRMDTTMLLSETERAPSYGKDTVAETELKVRQGVVARESVFLFNVNIIMGVLYALTAALLLLLSVVTSQKHQKYGLYTSFPRSEEEGVLKPRLHNVWNIPINLPAILYLALGAVNHLLCALPLRTRYEAGLIVNQNRTRWVIESFAAPLLLVQVAIVSGVRDIHTLWCLFGLTHTALLFGLLFEMGNGDRRNRKLAIQWLPLQLSAVPMIFVWATIACFFFWEVAHGGQNRSVWGAMLLALIFVIVRGYNTIQQWSGHTDYVKGELAASITVLVFYELVAWTVFGSRRRRYD
jgi:hypothetical protein